MVRSDDDHVRLKIWSQTSCCCYDCESYLLHHLVPCFWVLEDAACKVHGLLGIIFFLDESEADCVRWCGYVHYEGEGKVRFGQDRRVVRSCFKVLKFCSHVSSKVNLVDFFRSWIIGLVLSTNFGWKREMAVSLPTSRCTSLMFAGLLMSMMVWHFSGLASIPRCVSMKPRNFPPSTPNVHFLGFSLMLYARKGLKTCVRSAKCCFALGDLTMMSLTYTSTNLPKSGWKTLSIKRWYVALAFLRPKGMTL